MEWPSPNPTLFGNLFCQCTHITAHPITIKHRSSLTLFRSTLAKSIELCPWQHDEREGSSSTLCYWANVAHIEPSSRISLPARKRFILSTLQNTSKQFYLVGLGFFVCLVFWGFCLFGEFGFLLVFVLLCFRGVGFWGGWFVFGVWFLRGVVGFFQRVV